MVPLNQLAGVQITLTFIETILKQESDWQSKDILFLFYEETDYSLAVKEFLNDYYNFGRKGQKEDPFQKRVHGRCGYIRQAFPFIVKDADFTKLSLMVDGLNQQLNDLDFYDAMRKAVKSTNSLTYDTDKAYYRNNQFIKEGYEIV